MNNFRGLEWIIVFVVMFAILNGAFKAYRTVMIYAKEVSLKSEIGQIRIGIELYKAKYGIPPERLVDLEEKNIMTFENHEFFFLSTKIKRKTTNGVILDPFEVPYLYNSKTGSVKSNTRGYEKY